MGRTRICLWYDKEASEAVEFYANIFPNTVIGPRSHMSDTPSGEVDIFEMQIMGRQFILMSAGPHFLPNPAISFHIPCHTAAEVDQIWNKLAPSGKVLMELGSYPFSARYGWVEDKYGVSWQIIMVPESQKELILTPVLMYTQSQAGHALEAAELYTHVFESSNPQIMMRYGAEQTMEKADNIAYGEFEIDAERFGFMDSSSSHDFVFNEAISIMVNCKTQKEIDFFYDKLSAHPEAEQCGWLKDKYGVSWQIIPENLGQLLYSGDVKEKTKIFLAMKKIEIDKLK